jgi:regulatory protein
VGVITDVQSQKRRQTRVSLYLDEKFWTGMPADLAVQLKLTAPLGEGVWQTGAEVSAQRRAEVEEEVGRRLAVDRAAMLLGYRARSEQELRRRLREAEFGDEVIDHAIAVLAEYDFIDDLDFSRQMIEAQRFKGKARFAVSMELRRKGVDGDIIEQALDAFYPEQDELDVALSWARPRFQDSDKGRAKLTRQLASRGFSFDVIGEVFEELDDVG